MEVCIPENVGEGVLGRSLLSGSSCAWCRFVAVLPVLDPHVDGSQGHPERLEDQ